jgi:hypothetical protein
VGNPQAAPMPDYLYLPSPVDRELASIKSPPTFCSPIALACFDETATFPSPTVNCQRSVSDDLLNYRRPCYNKKRSLPSPHNSILMPCPKVQSSTVPRPQKRQVLNRRIPLRHPTTI